MPVQLSRVVLQALAADPAHRFTSASAMRRALDSVEPGEADDAGLPSGNEDETTSFHHPVASSYIPPAAPPAPAPARRRPPAPPRPQRRNGAGAWVVTLVALAAVVGVVWLVFAIGSGGLRIGTPGSSPGTDGSPRNGRVIVPDTVGMTFDEGIAAARAAGLNWTVACDTQPDRPEEIYAQEPAAGEEVAPGSRFTMFFPRYAGYCDGG